MSARTTPKDRTLHLVDLENVVGDPFVKGAAAADVYETVLTAGRHRAGDLVVVAANPWMLFEFGSVPHTPCQMLAAQGRDGADLALLRWASASWIVARFERLVVASGDGIFADVVRAVRDAGTWVDVVHRGGSLSSRLRTAEVGVVRVGVPSGCTRRDRPAARTEWN